MNHRNDNCRVGPEMAEEQDEVACASAAGDVVDFQER